MARQKLPYIALAGTGSRQELFENSETFSSQKYRDLVMGTSLCPEPGASDGDIQDDSCLTLLTLLIDKSESYRVYDRFEEEEITVLENGDFLVRVKYLMDEWAYGVIFSFGAAAEVLEPAEVKREVLRRLRKMQIWDGKE